MGLYLCVFADDRSDDDELEGVEVGAYEDFNAFRVAVSQELETGQEWGARFPVLLRHADADGEWTPAEAQQVADELGVIFRELSTRPPRLPDPQWWQHDAMRYSGLVPASLAQCFVDVDGEVLIERLVRLCGVAVLNDRPVSFQ